jgi:hypothetical protein
MLIIFLVRCDGHQPKCWMWELHHSDCRYDKAPPIAQLVAMAKRLQEAQLLYQARTPSPPVHLVLIS